MSDLSRFLAPEIKRVPNLSDIAAGIRIRSHGGAVVPLTDTLPTLLELNDLVDHDDIIVTVEHLATHETSAERVYAAHYAVTLDDLDGQRRTVVLKAELCTLSPSAPTPSGAERYDFLGSTGKPDMPAKGAVSIRPLSVAPVEDFVAAVERAAKGQAPGTPKAERAQGYLGAWNALLAERNLLPGKETAAEQEAGDKTPTTLAGTTLAGVAEGAVAAPSAAVRIAPAARASVKPVQLDLFGAPVAGPANENTADAGPVEPAAPSLESVSSAALDLVRRNGNFVAHEGHRLLAEGRSIVGVIRSVPDDAPDETLAAIAGRIATRNIELRRFAEIAPRSDFAAMGKRIGEFGLSDDEWRWVGSVTAPEWIAANGGALAEQVAPMLKRASGYEGRDRLTVLETFARWPDADLRRLRLLLGGRQAEAVEPDQEPDLIADLASTADLADPVHLLVLGASDGVNGPLVDAIRKRQAQQATAPSASGVGTAEAAPLAADVRLEPGQDADQAADQAAAQAAGPARLEAIRAKTIQVANAWRLADVILRDETAWRRESGAARAILARDAHLVDLAGLVDETDPAQTAAVYDALEGRFDLHGAAVLATMDDLATRAASGEDAGVRAVLKEVAARTDDLSPASRERLIGAMFAMASVDEIEEAMADLPSDPPRTQIRIAADAERRALEAEIDRAVALHVAVSERLDVQFSLRDAAWENAFAEAVAERNQAIRVLSAKIDFGRDEASALFPHADEAASDDAAYLDVAELIVRDQRYPSTLRRSAGSVLEFLRTAGVDTEREARQANAAYGYDAALDPMQQRVNDAVLKHFSATEQVSAGNHRMAADTITARDQIVDELASEVDFDDPLHREIVARGEVSIPDFSRIVRVFAEHRLDRADEDRVLLEEIRTRLDGMASKDRTVFLKGMLAFQGPRMILAEEDKRAEDARKAAERSANRAASPSGPATPQQETRATEPAGLTKPKGVPTAAWNKAVANLEAIRLLKVLEAEGRSATASEIRTLRGFTGWGSLPQVFDKREWKPFRNDLLALLSEREYAQARASTTTAFYTPDGIVSEMWRMAEGLGFQGGRVLEPGCGSGRFLSAVPDRFAIDGAEPAKAIGVEIDPITAGIARFANPDAEILARGFETVTRGDGPFTLAVGNVPFGNFSLFMPDVAEWLRNAPVHDQFIGRSIDLVEEGGLVAVVVSAGTMDKADRRAREALYDKADLVDAVRLPNTAFGDETEVVTDVLVFRRRKAGEPKGDDRWLGTEPLLDAAGNEVRDPDGVLQRINGHFAANPQRILGTLEVVSSQFGWALTVKPGAAALEGALRTAVDDVVAKALAANGGQPVLDAEDRSLEPRARRIDAAVGAVNVKPYGHFIERDDAGVERVAMMLPDGTVADADIPARGLDEVKHRIALRDTARALLEIQSRPDAVEADWKPFQERLSALYDEQVRRFGFLNRYEIVGESAEMKLEKARERLAAVEDRLMVAGDLEPAERTRVEERIAKITAEIARLEARIEAGDDEPARREPKFGSFKNDPDYHLVKSLEVYNDETQTGRKAPIFEKRTVNPVREIRVDGNPQAAFLRVLDETGGVDMPRIADLAGVPVQEAARVLLDAKVVYLDHEAWAQGTERYLEADAYLSGPVRARLEGLKDHLNRCPADAERFAANRADLEAAQPAEILPSEISAAPGAPWMPQSVVERYAADWLQHNTGLRLWASNIDADFEPALEQWVVKISARGEAPRIKDREFGEVTARDFLEATFNGRGMTIYDDDGAKMDAETSVIRRYQERFRNDFTAWLAENPFQGDAVAAVYNRLFNASRERTWEGSGTHLTLPGSNPDRTLHGYQKDAVWRALRQGNVLLAHVVGAGKSLVMSATAMEKRRLGQANKPAAIVPNHMVEQFAAEFRRQYPNANILVADRENMSAARRVDFCERIRTGDYDCVIFTHSTFQRVGVSMDTQRAYVEQRIAEMGAAIQAAKENSSKSTVKRLETARKNLEKRLAKMANQADNGPTFESLGIDYVMIDEAHLYKNLAFSTNIEGISAPASARAEDLRMKLLYLEQQNPGRSVMLSTATPIANAVAEVWTMMRYCHEDALRQRRIDTFDGFAATFARTEERLELAPDGHTWRTKTRLSRYANVPELLSLFREVADVVGPDKLNFRLPIIINGHVREDDAKRNRPGTVVVKPSDEVKAFVETLAARAEAVAAGEVEPHIDNMLKITSDGRKAALDPRLVGLPVAEDGGKIGALAENAARIYEETRDTVYPGLDGEPSPQTGSLQLLFCDLGTPGNETFDVYAAAKAAMIEEGIPAERIRFVHEAQDDKAKEDLYRDCREGKVSVLFGSTEKMGVGTNVQKRLVHLHHLDAPWRPADVEQRNGRIVRQGNLNEHIGITTYVTEGTFDTFMWQSLERKAGFIGQIMSGKVQGRELEDDMDETTLTFSEVKALATGNPLLLEKADLDRQIKQMDMRRMETEREMFRQRRAVDRLGAEIREIDRVMGLVRQDLGMHNAPESGFGFDVAVKHEYLRRNRPEIQTFESRNEALLAVFGLRASKDGKPLKDEQGNEVIEGVRKVLRDRVKDSSAYSTMTSVGTNEPLSLGWLNGHEVKLVLHRKSAKHFDKTPDGIARGVDEALASTDRFEFKVNTQAVRISETRTGDEFWRAIQAGNGWRIMKALEDAVNMPKILQVKQSERDNLASQLEQARERQRAMQAFDGMAELEALKARRAQVEREIEVAAGRAPIANQNANAQADQQDGALAAVAYAR